MTLRDRLKKLRKRRGVLKRLLDSVRKRIRGTKHVLRRRRHRKRGPKVMYDAVAVGNIPPSAAAVGCYVGPSIVTCPEVNARFPHARKVRITQAGLSTVPADCVDVEPSDATNATGTTWVKRQLAAGRKRPIVYTSASNVAALIDTLAKAGVHRSEYVVWSAHYGHGEHICSPSKCGYPEADGTQWTDTALGRSLDQSLLGPSFWN